jgi:non-specific serine/threonine protein kinase/serine/threonine-protein kinase
MIDTDLRVAELFASAIDLDPARRDAFLVEHCGPPELLAQVRSLIVSHDEVQAGSFMEGFALEHAAEQSARIEADETRVGEWFGRYRIVSLIGDGGMGEVYLAEDSELNRQVAIKIIKSGFKTNEVLRRFRNEQQMLANLQHLNIARLLDVGRTADGLPFFVMEYVAGEPVDSYCNRHQLAISERLKLFRSICDGVQYAHQRLIIHRDLKPTNILVTKEGVPKLLDFGIAKLLVHNAGANETRTLLRMLTPEYASPEQVKGEAITTASDVYSLGVLLYELLSGRRPYQGRGLRAEDIDNAGDPERPSSAVSRRLRNPENDRQVESRDVKLLRGDVDNIVLMALRKEPQRRYAAVSELLDDIRRHLEGLPVAARQDTVRYRMSKFVRRNKLAVSATALVLLTLIGGVITTTWQAHSARLERAKADQRFGEVRTLAHTVLFDYHDAIASLPGSTPVRERLVQDAVQYLDRLSQPGNDVSLQRELATAYLRVGDVQGRPYKPNLGHTEQALVSYQKALKILEELNAGNSLDKDLQETRGTAYERIGNLQLRKGDWLAAQSQNEKALAIRQALLAGDPGNVNSRREVADSFVYVGDGIQPQCIDAACMQKALSLQRTGLVMIEALARVNSADLELLRDEALGYSKVGLRLSWLGQITKEKAYLKQALASQGSSLGLREKIAAAAPNSAVDRRNLADENMLRSDAQRLNGDLNGALSGYRNALLIFRSLYSVDANNAEALRDLSFVHFKLASALVLAHGDAPAREHYNEVLELDRRLQATDPGNREDLQIMAATHQALSDLSAREGDLSLAIDERRKSIAPLESIAGLPNGAPSEQVALLQPYFDFARLLVRTVSLGQHDDRRVERLREARDWYQKTLELTKVLTVRGQEGVSPQFGSLVADELARVDEALSKSAKRDKALKEQRR